MGFSNDGARSAPYATAWILLTRLTNLICVHLRLSVDAFLRSSVDAFS